MKSRYYLIIGVGLGLLLVLIVGLVFFQPYQYQGSLIETAVPAADFNLMDQSGGEFRLSEQRGKIVLLFFGYTHCGDVCPITLSMLHQIRTALEDRAYEVRFVYITVDPDRDTPEVMKAYIENFDPSFEALTGSKQALEKVWIDYGVYRALEEPNAAGDYSVDHTTRLYLIDQAGNLRLTYPFGFEAEKIMQDISYMLRKGG